MAKVALALGAFILGVCFSSLLRSHTSLVAQAPSPKATPQPAPPPQATPQGGSCVVDGFTSEGNRGYAFNVQGVQPVASIAFGPKLCRGLIKQASQSLDGFDCDGCTFQDVTLEYSGGAYNLQNAHFSGQVRVVLKGAAANTVAILPLLQAIAAGQPGEAPNPNRPIIKSAAARRPVLISWRSPY